MELESADNDVKDEVKFEGENQLDYIMNDFGNLSLEQDFNKSDVVFFVVDCYDIVESNHAQFLKIIEGYLAFVKNKIISNPKDKVGLILYGLDVSNNSLGFRGINVVFKLEIPNAKRIKEVGTLSDNFLTNYKKSQQKPNLHQVLWVFDNEIKEVDKRKNFIRLFLFTGNDSPHPIGSHQRIQAIAHATKLAEAGIQIQLFPLQSTEEGRFDIRHFFIQILTLDQDQLNSGVLDSSDRIMDLQQRLKQKEHKKRTLNRLLFKIGEDTTAAVKIYSLYHKAKKPSGQKLHARTNQPLKKVTKLISKSGEPLFEADIESFYPLGGEKVLLSKADMKELKSIQPPGMTLIGFKPKDRLKCTHNYRSSYFLYPDQEYVTGSSQLFDALVQRMTARSQIAIVKFMPRVGCQTRFGALIPQKEEFDENHIQIPPGFNLIFLPYSDDIVNFTHNNNTEFAGVEVSSQLIQVTKLFINNLTLSSFDPKSIPSPAMQLFFNTLQAHALGEQAVEEQKDVMMPGAEMVNKNRELLHLLDETVLLEAGGGVPAFGEICNQMADEDCSEEPKKRAKKKVKQEKDLLKSEVKSSKSENGGEDDVQASLRQGNLKGLTVAKLKDYLKSKSLKTNGNKQELINRAMEYLAS